MKKVLVLVVAVLALAGATSAATARPTATELVSITATGFSPDTVAIDQGDTVTWKNNDSADHQVVSDTGQFKSPVLKPGQSYSYRFATSTTDSYYDGKKPAMTGLVVVRGTDSSVTIGLANRYVVYGSATQVAGGIGTPKAGEVVTLHFVPYGRSETTKTVTTDSDGTFQLTYKPQIRTGIHATWGPATSEQRPQVNVRPKVFFRVVSAKRNLYSVRVAALRSYAGKVVSIQRLSSNGHWVTTRKVMLNRRGRASFFGTFARGRTHARAFVNATPGYINGFSVTKIITR
jgi:plastocyanin